MLDRSGPGRVTGKMEDVESIKLSYYRGRLAPSPTGYLHLGHAATFWTAFQRAHAAGGTLVMRNEDVDPQRSREEFSEAMLKDLSWLGIRWQEGPDLGGPWGPYQQSQCREFYLEAWRRLLADGSIYPCDCSRKRAAEESLQAIDPDDEPIYSGRCRERFLEEMKNDPPTTPAGRQWRFRVQDGQKVEFTDRAQGLQSRIAGSDFGDFVIWRRDDVPAYQLAVVVDDQRMQITEVVRGMDLLVSAARQILLIQALGYRHLDYYHCPLITDGNGRRLAKRAQSLSLNYYREELGWSPQRVLQEIETATRQSGKIS